MYSQDSFFDLSLWGRIGLVGISTVLYLTMILATRWVLRGRAWWMRIAGALGMFWAFVWASPQIYYMYYRTIIPDLPLQWVIWPPPNILDPAAMLAFQGPQNLSAHSQGLLGWSLILIAVFLGKWR